MQEKPSRSGSLKQTGRRAHVAVSWWWKHQIKETDCCPRSCQLYTPRLFYVAVPCSWNLRKWTIREWNSFYCLVLLCVKPIQFLFQRVNHFTVIQQKKCERKMSNFQTKCDITAPQESSGQVFGLRCCRANLLSSQDSLRWLAGLQSRGKWA